MPGPKGLVLARGRPLSARAYPQLRAPSVGVAWQYVFETTPLASVLTSLRSDSLIWENTEERKKAPRRAQSMCRWHAQLV